MGEIPGDVRETMAKEFARGLMDVFITPKWIPVSERLPPLGESVIAVSEGFMPKEMWLDHNHEWHAADNSEEDCVTHWMPMPEPPEEKQ